jgi:2-aminobenzoate-CoA ligase
MTARPAHPYLSPSETWPTIVRRAPDLQYPATLNLASVLLDRHCQAGQSAKTAIVFGAERLSYGELQRLTNRIGHALVRLGARSGDRIVLRFLNCPLFVATWLAVQKIGAICVATMPMLRARELAYIIKDAEASLVVCQEELIDELARARSIIDHRLVVIHAGGLSAGVLPSSDRSLDRLLVDASDHLDSVPVGSDDVVVIAYTSGSTGPPKGATHTPADILASADSYSSHVLGTNERDVLGGHPTLAFTFGLGGLLVFPLRAGATISLIDRFSPASMLARISSDRISILFCAATTYRLLLQERGFERKTDISSLRLCISAGEPLPASVYDEWYRRTGVEILDGIGSTEMFHIFISARAGQVRAGSTGTPVPGYEARIVDDNLEDVATGEQGLLAVRGPTGCRYWRKPDRQREYVRGGWNVTGDVYRRDADGYYWYQCRNDDLIICGGYNIAGPEIENVLLEHAAVLEAAVVAAPDSLRGAVPKAFVVLKAGIDPSAALVAELQDHVKRELAPYKYPREVEFVPALPRTETGKIRRVELRERERLKAGGES